MSLSVGLAALSAPHLPLLQVQGTLMPEALYVERAADQELLHALLRGELCYILAPRQIGKSSLQARARRRLRERGVACASIDLTQIGGDDLGPEGWCRGLIQELADGFALGDPEPFWQRHRGLLPLHRFSRYLHEQVLPGLTTASAVVFIDEVEAVLGLPPYARDDFFASVRAFYNARARDPACARLTFCLCGVATASELMRDAARTPFNIGREITLRDFSRREADAFLPALAWLSDAAAWLEAVYEWTCGHPYMTQRLCAALQQCEPAQDPRQAVAGLVEQHFLRRGRTHDPNLAYAERRFFAPGQPRAQSNQMLQVYGALLRDERLPTRGRDAVQEALRLTGMTAEREEAGQALLAVRNRVFAAVFGAAWVSERESECFYGEALAAWLRGQRRPDYLLRGAALRQALGWAEGRDDLSAEEHRFLRASQAAEQATEKRRRRGLQGLGALVAVIALLLGRAFWETRRFRQQDQWSYRGFRAASLAQQSGHELEALGEGVLAVAPALQAGAEVPRQAAEGLALALTAARRSLPLLGHTQGVTGVYFSPDSRRLLSISTDHSARLWDAEDGHPIRVLTESRDFLYAAAFAPDSRRVCTGSEDRTLRCYDATDGRLLVASDLRIRISHLTFSPDGQVLLATSGAGASVASGPSDVLALRASDLALRHALSGHSRYIAMAAVSPDGGLALSAASDNSARLWDLRSGAELARWRDPLPVIRVAFSPAGNQLAYAGEAGVVSLRRLPLQEPERRLEGHQGSVLWLSYSPDGAQLLTAGADSTTRLWDVAAGAERLVLRRHHAPVLTAAFSPDGRQVATAGGDGTVWLYASVTGDALAALRGHQGPVNALAFSADGRRLVTGGADGALRLWSGQTGRAHNTLPTFAATLWDATVSPDGARIATADGDRRVRLWDSATGLPIAEVPGAGMPSSSPRFLRDGRLVTVHGAATAHLWSGRDGAALALLQAGASSAAVLPCGARCERVVLWEPERLLIFDPARATEPVWVRSALLAKSRSHFITTNHQGDRFVVTGSAIPTSLWDGEDGHLVAQLAGHKSGTSLPIFSPDDSLLATPGDEGTVRLWDGRTGVLRGVLVGHSDEVNEVAMSRDARLLASGSIDKTVRLWDLASQRELRVLRGHQDGIRRVALSPDGTKVLSASYDQTARVWDAGTGAELAVLRHQGWVAAATFSPDGTWIMTAGADRCARLWDARTYQPLQRPADPADLLLPVPGEGQAVLAEPAPGGSAASRRNLQLACRLLRDRGKDAGAQRECLRQGPPVARGGP